VVDELGRAASRSRLQVVAALQLQDFARLARGRDLGPRPSMILRASAACSAFEADTDIAAHRGDTQMLG
jgi:hypothetical protein